MNEQIKAIIYKHKVQSSKLKAQSYVATNTAAFSIQHSAFSIFILLLLALLLLNPVQALPTMKAGVMESTPVSIIAEWPINESTQIGEHFSARIVEDIIGAGNEILIPKGSRVIGTVVELQNAKSFNRDGRVDIRFEKIVFPDNITSYNINADGTLIKDPYHTASLVGDAALKTTGGAITGAIAGFKFGGILGTGTSTASNLAIGAISGAGLSLISFIAKKGKEVDITPGLPMTLNIISMDDQHYKEQQIVSQDSQEVTASIKNTWNNKIAIEIENKMRHSIPLSNLKIVDGLGYTVKPNLAFSYHDIKAIPAQSSSSYEFEFNPTTKKARYWLVLTDSFDKQEYFRKEIR